MRNGLAVGAFVAAFVVSSCGAGPPVRTGAEVLLAERLGLVEGKRLGLVTNHTGRLADGTYLVDRLIEKGIRVTALFAPEHGIRGLIAAGEHISDSVDARTGIPIVSLYGRHRKPTQPMLNGIDVLVYDVQDVGVRFYTYISTMVLCMEAAAEKGIPFVVLDRPNPLGGHKVDGPVMEDSLRSFVGLLPIPVVYGLTCGELALMTAGESWLSTPSDVDLHVVPVDGWTRDMTWDQTGREWIAPSPNLPTPATAMIYPATCFIEATNFSEGRGTAAPFATIGAPFVSSDSVLARLHALSPNGPAVSAVTFVPTSSKHKGTRCNGITVTVTDWKQFSPVHWGSTLLHVLYKLYPDQLTINARQLSRLTGSTRLTSELIRGEIVAPWWTSDVAAFQSKSKKYHLYR